LIQNAIVSAVKEDAEEDGSFLLFNGRSVPLQLIYKDQHGHKNTRSVSIKGTLYHNKKRLVCIVAIRPIKEHASSIVSVVDEDDAGNSSSK
jgi:hypothetical protein